MIITQACEKSWLYKRYSFMLLQQKANGSASEHMEWFLYPFVIIASVIIICFVIPTTIADCLDRKKEKKKRLANQELVQRAQVL